MIPIITWAEEFTDRMHAEVIILILYYNDFENLELRCMERYYTLTKQISAPAMIEQ